MEETPTKQEGQESEVPVPLWKARHYVALVATGVFMIAGLAAAIAYSNAGNNAWIICIPTALLTVIAGLSILVHVGRQGGENDESV
jgi:hypothetical protein